MLLAGSRLAVAGAFEDVITAVREDRTDVVIQLVQRGLDPNTADIYGTTLLMVAARNGNAALLDFLLRSGANIMNQNRYGDTAIGIAALNGHESAVKRLLEAGARGDGPGWSALHYAAYAGHTGIVHFLISRGVNLDARAPNQQTALMLAAKNGHLDAVRLLVNAGARPNMGDLRGNTALSIAVEAGNDEIAGVLRAGAIR